MKNLCEFILPVHDAVRPGELRAFGRVLLELDVYAVWVFEPALPRLVATEFFRGHFHAGLQQFFALRVNVVHFQTKMVDARTAEFGVRRDFKKFDKLPRRDLEVKTEQLAVLEKIEMVLEPERVTIKGFGALQVFREDAEMGEGFDHGLIELKVSRTERKNFRL
jgi:hypothetical protein